jgi:protein phosphatase
MEELGRGSLTLTGAMLSHPGAVRSHNEDSVAYVLPSGDHALRRGALMLVADGMGGHAAGEIASQIAAETIRQQFYLAEGPVPDVLAHCFSAANTAIHQRSLDDAECSGMGTTCTAVAVRGCHAYLAHVGDSRAYLLRDGALLQLSDDHTLVAQLMRDGVLTEAEAAASPDRNVIVKALGTRSEVAPDIWDEGLELCLGDRLVLCSDGLSDCIDDETIGTIVRQHCPFEACNALIEAALQCGGHDNISVGVFAIVETEPQRPDRPTRRIQVAASPAQKP